MVRSFVLAALPQLPELIVALVGLVFGLAGRLRTSSTGLAVLGWVLGVASLLSSLTSLLVAYVVIERSGGDNAWLALRGIFSIVIVLLTLGSWACFLIALLREPAAATTQPQYYPPPPGSPRPGSPPPGSPPSWAPNPGAPTPQDPGQWSPPRT